MTDFQFWTLCAILVFFTVPGDRRSWSRTFVALVFALFALVSLGVQGLLEDKQPRPIVVQPR